MCTVPLWSRVDRCGAGETDASRLGKQAKMDDCDGEQIELKFESDKFLTANMVCAPSLMGVACADDDDGWCVLRRRDRTLVRLRVLAL